MKLRKPDYYERFHCIAGACKDSCCIGWEIDVDADRLEEYRNMTGALGERLQSCINWEEGHFILQGKEERCPFLNSENLCDLIIGLGEEALCEICREHPRYYEWYDDLTEVGVGLCCEEAARLVLECEAPAGFIEEVCDSFEDTCGMSADGVDNEDTDEIRSEPDDTLDVLFSARETAYAILQNRTDSIWERLFRFLLYIDELQQALDFENLDEIEESASYYKAIIDEETERDAWEMPECSMDEHIAAFRELINICKKLEPIDESWPNRLDVLERMMEEPEEFCRKEQAMLDATKTRDYEYEHLAVYLVYRYFMKCRVDGDVYSRGCLVAIVLLLIRLLDVEKFKETGVLTKEDRAQHAKDCSKEIEYSEENLELLAEIFWENGIEKILGGFSFTKQ